MLLVTGGLGYLGRRLVAHLLAATEARIRLLVRPGTRETALAQEHPDANRLELFPADAFTHHHQRSTLRNGTSELSHNCNSVVECGEA